MIGSNRSFGSAKRRSRMIEGPVHSRGFVHEHSLSIASISILILWIGLYIVSDPSTHLGSFYGNAIADWSGVVVTVLATKYLYEKNSAESRRPPKTLLRPFLEMCREHSLSIFLLITGVGWVALYIHMNSE